MDEDDFDLGGFDEAYSPDDFSQSDMDFATAVGMQTADRGSDDDSAAQFIANQFAQPQAGMNRSNIRGTSNFDPQFAAAFDISRGLDPTNNFGGTGGLAVPSYLRPQVQGDLVLNEAGDRMMYGSGLEKFAQETAPELVRRISDFGIGSLIRSLGTTISDAFTDAKSALGFDGGAQGGLKVEDLQPTMGTLDPSDRFLGDMSQQGAGITVTDPVVPAAPPVTMGALPQVSPLFDQFGNPYRTRADRNAAEAAQQVQSGGIASIAPLPQLRTDFRREIREGKPIISGTTYTGPGGSYTFSETMGQIKPRGGVGAVRSPDVYSEGNFDGIEDDIMEVADARSFNVLQGLGTKFNPQINDIIQRNISPNLRFDTTPRRDPNDPNKVMPYLGFEYTFPTV